ncbi:MAG: tail protein X [Lachnospiraceae bacterium]|nr:tail protein X [Lachnospiraceae bacterium]MCM1240439.1 tail protein X [Lachnospiraceae bacterium]
MPKIYATIAGDTWDIVSYKTLGSEMHKNAILEENIAYRETVVFPAGVSLVIPDIEPGVSEDLPPWKRGMGIE